jgi:hypothetical protein
MLVTVGKRVQQVALASGVKLADLIEEDAPRGPAPIVLKLRGEFFQFHRRAGDLPHFLIRTQ